MKRVSMACKKTECKITPKPEHGEDRTGLENKNIQPQVKFTGSDKQNYSTQDSCCPKTLRPLNLIR